MQAERAAGKSTVIIAFTASGLDAMMAEARAAGAHEVVLKPYKEAELLDHIGALLQIGYAYEDEPISGIPSRAVPRPAAQTAPLLHLFERVPRALVDELHVAAIQARAAQIERMAAEIAEHSPDAAVGVRALAQEFRYEELAAVLEAVPKGAATV